MSRPPRKHSPRTPVAEDGLGERYRRACQFRDELADGAWTCFLLRIECALADEAAREFAEGVDHPDRGRVRFSWRRVRRFVVEVLRALPSLFWDMLCAASYPMLQMLVMLVVSTVVNLLGVAFMRYVIYKMLTVW